MYKDLTDGLILAGFKKKKLSELKVPNVFNDLDFSPELLPICDKSMNNGILVLYSNETHAVKYSLKKMKANSQGLSKPVICDFCYTFQPRERIGLITFTLNREKTRSVAYYCCADLQCSLNVRGLTDASLVSKSQLREDITPEKRKARFIFKTTKIFETNGAVILNADVNNS